MRFDLARVGYSRDSEEFRVNSHRLAQFAAALGDANPAHREGRVAPPVFAHIPAAQSMVETVRAATDGFILHGEHDFHFHQAIEPGMRLFTLSTLQGMRATKAGVQLFVRSETRTHGGEPVTTQYSTCLVQGGSLAEDRGEAAPAVPAGAVENGAAAVLFELPADQAHRYAEAARDYSLYTLDHAAAQVRGFPAAFLHGMCTIALASAAVVERACGGDSRRLKRLGARFTHPLYMTPGQKLTTRLSPVAAGVLHFECSDAEGNLVVKRGHAEIRP